MTLSPADVELARNVALGVALAAACGLRIFLPPTVLSAAALLGWVHLSGDLGWLGTGAALTVLGVATVLEVAAYHVPWLDNALDHLGAPVAVAAGTVMAASLLPPGDPLLRWTVAAVAGGGVAGGVHLSLAALRHVSTLTTGGLGNPVLALVELAGSAVVSVIAVLAPVLALAGVAMIATGAVVLVRRRRAAAPPRQR
jgi:hypothetical protein